MDVLAAEPRIRLLLSELLGIDSSRLEAEVSLRDDLALDSLDLVELASVLEEELRIALPRSLPTWVRTYGDVIELVELLAPPRRPTLRVAVGSHGTEPALVTRCDALTPYAIETIVEDARHLASGTELDVTVADADDLLLARVRTAFAPLAGYGIVVHVHRTGTAPGANPHPHAA